MSDHTKVIIARTAAMIGILSGLAGLFGAWVILPYRMDAAEKAIRDVQKQSGSDHDLLQRIDERTARMEKAIDRLSK